MHVAVRVISAPMRLAIGLQAGPGALGPHHGVADPVAALMQLRRQSAQAFGGPTQQRHRIASLTGRNLRHQVIQQRRVGSR
jgi:hypothetical protein